MFKLDCYVFITIKETSVDYTQKEMRRESKLVVTRTLLNTEESIHGGKGQKVIRCTIIK
jgi:hypothetical protein